MIHKGGPLDALVCSATAAAAQTYEAIGFQRVGDNKVALLATPTVLRRGNVAMSLGEG